MKWPNCGEEMQEGFLFSSKDGSFSFGKKVPSVFTNAKKTEGFIRVTKFQMKHRCRLKANACEACRKIVVDY